MEMEHWFPFLLIALLNATMQIKIKEELDC